MGRRRKKGRAVTGWVVVDKPEGPTSTQVVSKVRRIFDAAKAGHAGTLDPLATGLLPVALGEATKTIPFIVEASKVYRFTARWGVATATDDREGAVIAESPVRPDRAAIVEALKRFEGEIEQIPPKFSAIKVNGERAYDLAREGEEVELQPRIVHIERAELVEMPDADHAVIEICCGKGTYVRSLVRDLAEALGTVAHVTQLRRTRLGPFTEEMSIPLEKLTGFSHSAAAEAHLLALETSLDDIPAVALSAVDAARLKRGQAVLMRGRNAPIHKGTVYATERGRAIAIAECSKGEIRPVRVFNLPAEEKRPDVD